MTVLIIGGVCQGKREYAVKRFALCEAEIWDPAQAETLFTAQTRAVDRLELWVKQRLLQGETPSAIETAILPLLVDRIVLCNDISCGIIPTDPFERQWRETVGRLLCDFAAQADQVVRIQSGIPQIIKGEAD